jgi:hypothetical protein
VLGNDLEGARDFAQESCTEVWSLCFVPIYRVVQVADRPFVELDSQALPRSQSKLDSFAYFRPVFELCDSAGHFARAAIKLFEPCIGGIGILGYIEALNELSRQPRAFASGQLQKLRKNFAMTSHRTHYAC